MPFIFIFFLIALTTSYSSAQLNYVFDSSVPVGINDSLIFNKWTGGFNAPQYSSMDLNNDGKNDLIVFERSGGTLYPFLRDTFQGRQQYIYHPEYRKYFPEIQSWMLLVDYNRDGKKDIFAHTNLGIMVYKNTSSLSGISWQLMADPVYTSYFGSPTNLYVDYYDLPALIDMDNDGDIDIANYNFYNGTNIEYHKNLSMETYGNCDSLKYMSMDDCWGGVYETTCGYSFGSNCPDFRMSQVQHISPATLFVHDVNGDGKKDVFSGKDGCQIFELQNNGTNNSPSFNSYKPYPSSKPLNFPGLPAMYYEDVDFDGVKDIISSPSVLTNNTGGIDNIVDFQNSSWFYKNTGNDSSLSLTFKQSNFLQEKMLDLGEYAAPIFADYDADGDKDMFIANAGLQHGNNFFATVYLFKNTGTITNPQFELLDEDYLNLSSHHYYYIRPAFGDINGDSSPDFAFACYDSANTGTNYQIRYILNSNAAGLPFSFDAATQDVLSVLPVKEDNIYFFDINNDGYDDLLLGGAKGRLFYYKNDKNFPPTYTLISSNYGNVFHGRHMSLTIDDFNSDGNPDLLTSDDNGMIWFYPAFQSQPITSFPSQNFTLDSDTSFVLGTRLFISSADINNDTIPEIFVGTNAGGVMCLNAFGVTLNTLGYKPTGITPNPIPTANTSNDPASIKNFEVYPNPATSSLTVSSPADAKMIMLDMMGRKVADYILSENQKLGINTESLSEGVYFLQILVNDKTFATKKVLIRR